MPSTAQLDSMAFEGVWGDPFAGHPQPVIFETQHFELARPQMLAAAFRNRTAIIIDIAGILAL
jgi:hypothetical protein